MAAGIRADLRTLAVLGEEITTGQCSQCNQPVSGVHGMYSCGACGNNGSF